MIIRMLLVFAIGAMVTGAFSEEQGVSVRQAALEFNLIAHDGSVHDLEDYKGRALVVVWYHPECAFMKRLQETRVLQRLHSRYAGDSVGFVAVNSSHFASVDVNKEAADRLGIPFPILDDHSGDVGRLWGAKTTPHVYIIDAQGYIAYEGAIDDDPMGRAAVKDRRCFVSQALDELIAGEPLSQPYVEPYGCYVKYKESSGGNTEAGSQ